MQPKHYPDLFKHYPHRRGKAWLRQVDVEDRRVFARVGLEHANLKTDYQFWSLGGQARAKNARRDSKGRFIKGDTHADSIIA